MNRVIIFLFIFSISLSVLGQTNQSQMDENGFTNRSIKSHKIFEQLNQTKDANEWTSIGPYGGDVFDIAVNPLNPDVVFAAAGIPYKSIDGGQT